jgi:hypothetical protein
MLCYFLLVAASQLTDTEVVMVTKRSGLIPALLLLAAMLAVMADPAPAAALLIF